MIKNVFPAFCHCVSLRQFMTSYSVLDEIRDITKSSTVNVEFFEIPTS